jgi:serine/threonine protein kinase
MTLPYEQLLFMAASSLTDEDERWALLDGACLHDPELRRRLDALFEVQDAAAAYFESKPEPEESGTTGAPSGKDEVDTNIGRYRLLDRLGEGGYGVVYLAEQSEPVRRKVALKIVRPGMDTEHVIARFEAERQSLAMMDHPNIARVLDAGATTSGRPFFVMELVDGEKITDFCDANRLGIRERLEIFVQVCQAIHHAHQKGVIHRDLKPSNILVRMQDTVPVPKVIDFGIAKAANRGENDDAYQTSTEQFLGTPAYMSPEVAAGGMDVDTRCDIHGLGTVLFELLTGRPPLDSERVRDLPVDVIRKIIREEDPTVPSALLAALNPDELEKTAARRSIEAPKLIQQVKGDLDWIVVKATARERDQRYESAHGLALDVNRHLNDEAVSAGPPDPFYRLAKLVRRNKVTVLSGAAVFLALTAGFGTSTVLFLREKEARGEQQRQRTKAEIARNNEVTLRRHAEYREKISHAAVQVSHGNFDAADRLLRSVPFGEAPPSLEAAQAYLKVGEWHVLAERWPEATDCFANLALVLPTIDPTDSFDISVVVIRAAALLCQAGDLERYEMIRRLAIERFSNTSSPVVAEQVFKTTLILQPREETLGSLRPLAEFLERSLIQGHPELQRNDFRTSWCSFALGLMRYREGNLDAASHWADRALPLAGEHVARQTMLRCLRGMIAFRRGDARAARTLLDEASKPIDAYFSKPIELDDGRSSWSDWVIARLLYREARALVGE